MEGNEISILIFVLVLMVGVFKNLYVAYIAPLTKYTNKSLIVWNYSDEQGWTSPTEDNENPTVGWADYFQTKKIN
jgi:hypothetical protein